MLKRVMHLKEKTLCFLCMCSGLGLTMDNKQPGVYCLFDLSFAVVSVRMCGFKKAEREMI